MISDNFSDAAYHLENTLETRKDEMSTDLQLLTRRLQIILDEIGSYGDIGYSYEDVDSEMVKDMVYDMAVAVGLIQHNPEDLMPKPVESPEPKEVAKSEPKKNHTRGVSVLVDGKVYGSVRDAAITLGLNYQGLNKALRDGVEYNGHKIEANPYKF